jgi:hypothetical protein
MRDLLSGLTGWRSTTHIFNTILSETGVSGGLRAAVRNFPVVRVAIYDSLTSVNKIIVPAKA